MTTTTMTMTAAQNKAIRKPSRPSAATRLLGALGLGGAGVGNRPSAAAPASAKPKNRASAKAAKKIEDDENEDEDYIAVGGDEDEDEEGMSEDQDDEEEGMFEGGDDDDDEEEEALAMEDDDDDEEDEEDMSAKSKAGSKATKGGSNTAKHKAKPATIGQLERICSHLPADHRASAVLSMLKAKATVSGAKTAVMQRLGEMLAVSSNANNNSNDPKAQARQRIAAHGAASGTRPVAAGHGRGVMTSACANVQRASASTKNNKNNKNTAVAEITAAKLAADPDLRAKTRTGGYDHFTGDYTQLVDLIETNETNGNRLMAIGIANTERPDLRSVYARHEAANSN